MVKVPFEIVCTPPQGMSCYPLFPRCVFAFYSVDDLVQPLFLSSVTIQGLWGDTWQKVIYTEVAF